MSPPRGTEPAAPAGDRMAFREVFLLFVPAAGAATFRQFGRYVFETLAEEAREGASGPRIGARLRAVAEDLRVSAHFLTAMGPSLPAGERTAEEGALVRKAESWGREVLELVRAVEGAVAAAGEGR